MQNEKKKDEDYQVPSIPAKSASLYSKEAERKKDGPFVSKKEEPIIVSEMHNFQSETRTSPPQITEKSSWSTTPSGGTAFSSVSSTQSSTTRVTQQRDIKIEMKSNSDKPQEFREINQPLKMETFKSSSVRTSSRVVRIKKTSENISLLTTTNINGDNETPPSVINEKTSTTLDSKGDSRLPFSTTAPEETTVLRVKDIRSQRSEPVQQTTVKTEQRKADDSPEQPMALLSALKYLKSPAQNEESVNKDNGVNGQPEPVSPAAVEILLKENATKEFVAPNTKPTTPSRPGTC